MQGASFFGSKSVDVFILKRFKMSSNNITIVALYKFVKLDNYIELKADILSLCNNNQIKGTLLLAKEGINGTIAGSDNCIKEVLKFFKQDVRFNDLECKKSFANFNPFLRMKVRLKKEIVTIGMSDIAPEKISGTYVAPEDWNDLIDDPDVTVIDTRNNYEYEIGTFKNAINPKTENFREFPEYVKRNLDPKKNKKIAMFCTGGIRCEKASSYMKQEGFEEVYHLKGGILKYLETVNHQQSTWNGECFVFDDRVAVKENLDVGSYDQCYGCRYPITEEQKKSVQYLKGIACPRCYHKTSSEQKKRFSDRQLQIDLAHKRGEKHIG